MLHTDASGLLVGAIVLGAIHGIEPGHGWPVAAAYALDRSNKWVAGLAASVLIGVGHLISSIAMVGAFFYAKAYFNVTQVNEPITLLGGVRIGGPVSIGAGILLVGLGVREYVAGRSHASVGHSHDGHSHHDDADHGHSHADEHDHVHDEHGHDPIENDHSNEGEGLRTRLRGFVPFTGGHAHSHGDLDGAADRGLLGIAWAAFVLGFAHEEEFEIVVLCAGSTHCLELVSAYAITVVVGIVGLTMILIAGYHHFEETVEAYTPYLPAVSAIVLVVMGAGFILGLF